jgi:hypothetical protein
MSILIGKHNCCYGNSSAWGSNELRDTNTIFSVYGEGFHLNRFLFEETLLKAAESQHDRFITIIRDSMTKLLLVENDDEEKYWKVSISSNSKLVSSHLQWRTELKFDCTYFFIRINNPWKHSR